MKDSISTNNEMAILKEIARNIRINIIKMLTEAKSGHTGGSLSTVEIITTLFFSKMNHKPDNPDWDLRDRFIISKGHGVPTLYCALAEAGYFPKDELFTLRRIGSRLQGHPARTMLPGIEASTGSLGQGLSIGIGMALAGKMDNKPYRVYCLMGDGESQAGQVWESAMCASHFKLDNLTAILDYNKAQIDGFVKDIMNLEPIKSKWESFGWNVIEIDGHNFEQIIFALDTASETKGKPTFIIANTIKGKGVSFVEADPIKWHGSVPSKDEAEKAIKEISNF